MGAISKARQPNQSDLKRNDGKFVAGVIYRELEQAEQSLAILPLTGRMTPRLTMAIIFDYPFKVCDVEKIIVPVDCKRKLKKY
jgi:hypothetical protein